MYIDKYLSWNFHVQQFSKKLRANGILSKLRHHAPIEACLQVYYAIVYSHLIYRCDVWGLTTEENRKQMKYFRRNVLELTFSDYNIHTNQLFMDLKLCNIIDLQSLIKLTFTSPPLFWVCNCVCVVDVRGPCIMSSVPACLLSLFSLAILCSF